MSTFLFAVGDHDRIAALHRSLVDADGVRTDGRPQATLARHERPGLGVLAIAQPPSVQTTGPSSGRLALGWALDHGSGSVDIGTDALIDAGRPRAGLDRREGQFVDLEWGENEVVVRRDAFGHYPVFWTSTGSGTVLISDSALVLRRGRDILGSASDEFADAVIARSRSLILTNQLLSSRTACRQIRYLPAGGRLRLRLTANGASIERSRSERTLGLDVSARDYLSDLVAGARQMAGSLLSIAAAFPDRTSLSLSGGLDSRILLAALALDPDVLRAIEITTGIRPDQASDRGAVEALADAYAFAVNPSLNAAERRQRTKQPLGHWALASLGTYDQVILRTSFPSTPMVNLGGQGGEALRGGPGEQRVRSLARNDDRRRRRSLRRQVRAGLRDIGADGRGTDALFHHWLGYRNPLHAGLPVGQGSPFAHRPLDTRQLVGLAVSDVNPMPFPAKGELSLSTDLLSVLGIEFARVPFAGGASGLPYSDIHRRHSADLQHVTVTRNDLDLYRINGDPDLLAIGASPILLRLVDDYRLAGATHDEQIFDRAQSSWALVAESDFAGWYRPHFEAVDDARQRGFPAETARAFRLSAGKLLGTDLWT